jgi:phage pi2 protein 07
VLTCRIPFEIKEDKEHDDLNQPDEDGWVTVTAKSRKSNRPFTEKNIEKIQKKQKKRKQQMVGSISFIYYRYSFYKDKDLIDCCLISAIG